MLEFKIPERCDSSLKAAMMLSCATGALLLATVASAQTSPQTSAQAASAADQADSTAGDIIVTAQKRSERLQDVPMSITAATGDALRARGVTSADDLGKLVPGFTFTKSNYGLPVYFLRGVGFFDTTLGVSPAVTVYTDQVPLPYSPMSRGATLDLERVEVLKGPQGTLFGQNSTGGAINYIAAKPTDHLEAGFDLTGGRFNQVDAEAFISGPIAEGLTARIAVRSEYQDDWQYNYVNGEKNGEKHFINGRALVDWQASSSLKFEFSATGWKDTSDAQQGQLIEYTPLQSAAAGGRVPPFPIATFPTAPNNDRATSFDPGADLRQNNQFYQFSLRTDYDFSDAAKLTSLTSYAHYKTSVPLDFDSSIYPLALIGTAGTIKSFSQEVRLDGKADRLRWMVGANYQQDTVNERSMAHGPTTGQHIGPFNYDGFFIDNLQKIKSYSGFGSLDFALTDRLTLQGSARYTKQDRSYAGCGRDDGTGQIATGFSFLSSLLSGSPQTISPGSCVTLNAFGLPQSIVKDSLNEDNVSWRGSINYKPNHDSLIYASITNGYKSGSFPTLPAAFASQVQPVKQESLLAYEAGAKASWFDRAVQTEGAVFYYDYSDKQLVGFRNIPPFGALPALVSIPKSRVWGAELNLALRPIKGLTLNAGGTYVNTKLRSDPINPTGPFPEHNTGTATFVGQSFPFTPKWQTVVDGQYSFAIGAGTEAYLGASVSSRTSTKGALLTNQASAVPFEKLLTLPGYSLVDVRAGINSSNDTWRIEVWGRNITNKFYLTNANRGNDFTYRFTGMPATYGVTLRYRFGS